MRKIWIAVILLIFLVPVVAVTAVMGSHPSANDNSEDHENPANGSGTITFTQTAVVSGPTTHGQNTLTVVKETLDFKGNLSGKALTTERIVKHNDTDDGANHIFTTYHGEGSLNGTLNGATVTLRIRYEGISNSTFTQGNFVFFGDTSTNQTAHGEGHFHGTSALPESGGSSITYTMHSHVGAHEEHPETREDEKEDD